MLKCDPPQSPSLCRDQWKEGRKGEELRPPGYQQLGAGERAAKATGTQLGRRWRSEGMQT